MQNKPTFLTKMQAAVTVIAQNKELLDVLVRQYFAEAYNSGGANAITDADCAPYGITAAQVSSGILFGQQLANMLANSAVQTNTYQITVDALRSDV